MHHRYRAAVLGVRRRLRPFGARSMARRLGDEGRFIIPTRARWIVGWVAAIAVLAVLALAFNLLGGNADGTKVGPAPSSSGAAQPASITFGTALGDARVVPAESATQRFTSGDLFAYSFSAAQPLPPAVYVEVARTGGGPGEIVQPPVGKQDVIPGDAIGYRVPTDDLLDAFGPGMYRMRIYLAPGGEPVAEGTFELVGAAPAGASAPP